MSGTFAGFPPAGLDVLAGLERDNTKAYFEAHRADYVRGLLEPAKQFVTALGPLLQRDVSSGIRAEPRVGGSLFRINNDLRFARDKPPYKTTLDMLFAEGEGRSAGLLLRLTPDEVHVGTGAFGVAGERLVQYRAALGDAGAARRLDEDVDRLIGEGAALSEPSRVRLPAGFTAGTPAARFAVRDGFHLMRVHPVPDVVTSEEFVGWCGDRLVPFAPVHRWLTSALELPA